ncbi:MAG: hypothetical protein ABL974_12485 [Prosthecobacter sp.]
MKRPLFLLILLLLLGSLAYWLLGSVADIEQTQAARDTEPRESTAKPQIPDEVTTTATQTPAPAVSNDKTGPRFKRAYMLSLDKGALTFIEQQDIEGDFAPKRRKPEEWSGMLRCRLMSENNAVLAEELLPAPDYVCAVLDPNSGTSKPVKYTGEGPVVFQVRLPRVKGAIRLDIYRIIQPGEPALEGLLGSISLPKS